MQVPQVSVNPRLERGALPFLLSPLTNAFPEFAVKGHRSDSSQEIFCSGSGLPCHTSAHWDWMSGSPEPAVDKGCLVCVTILPSP